MHTVHPSVVHICLFIRNFLGQKLNPNAVAAGGHFDAFINALLRALFTFVEWIDRTGGEAEGYGTSENFHSHSGIGRIVFGSVPTWIGGFL